MSEISLGTGLSGFIGSHLVKKLDFFTAIPHKDISNRDNYDPTPDYFYFLSAYGNLASHNDSSETRKANLGDLLNILPHLDPKKLKSFVYMSSSSVKLKRQTLYSRCKRAGEEIMLAWMEQNNASVCIIRPFSVTGVGEQPEHLIPKLIDSCLNGTRMDFVPYPVHDFIDVDDLVDGILNLSQNRARGIFELGTGQVTSNMEVLKLVEKVTGKEANIDKVDKLRDYDNLDWVSDNFKARAWGWLPKKTLEQSITEQVEAVKYGAKKPA